MDDPAQPVEKNTVCLILRHVENGERGKRDSIGSLRPEQGFEAYRAPVRQTENWLKPASELDIAESADNSPVFFPGKLLEMFTCQLYGQA